MADTVEFETAVVLLVDTAGRILLQLRDADAPAAPCHWVLPGGHIEPGEAPLAAARREMLEETGLEVTNLELFWHGVRTFNPAIGGATQWYVYCAASNATQEDVIVGEGAGMVFVPPSSIAGLMLAPNARFFIAHFLRSGWYQRVRSCLDL
jgi:8-oxo-dGTP pyrophosphatase MutT (NUDIX family)